MAEKTPHRKALTLEGREQQNTALAVDLAGQQLRDGSASPSVIVHYLKLAMEERKLEQLKIEQEIEMMKAKQAAAKSQASLEETYKKAVAALREYQGLGPQEVDPEDYPEPNDPRYYNPGGEAYGSTPTDSSATFFR